MPRTHIEIHTRTRKVIRATICTDATLQPSVGVETSTVGVGSALLLQRGDVAGYSRGGASTPKLATWNLGATAKRLAGTIGAAALLCTGEAAVRVCNLSVGDRSFCSTITKRRAACLLCLINTPAGTVSNCSQQRLSEDKNRMRLQKGIVAHRRRPFAKRDRNRNRQ